MYQQQMVSKNTKLERITVKCLNQGISFISCI
jgi:hypothetical protein